jgi:hypothetical protein
MRALAVLARVDCTSPPRRAPDPRDAEARHRPRKEYEGVLTVTKDGKCRKSWKSYRDGYACDARQLIRFTDPPEVWAWVSSPGRKVVPSRIPFCRR